MRRRRIRSAKRKQSGGGWNILIFLLFVAVVAVYAYLMLNRGSDNIPGPSATSPVGTSTIDSSATASPVESTVPDTTAANADRISETIKLQSFTLYGVQLGVYSQEANATAAAAQFRAQGAGAYILKEGGMYRVLDSVYYNQNDAKAVRDAYKAQDAESAYLLNVETASIEWKVSGSQQQIDAIKAAVGTFQSEIVRLIETQKKASAAGADADEARASVRLAADQFTAAQANLTRVVGTTKHPVINSLNECLVESAANLNALADGNSSNIVELLSNIKYNVIDILLMLENNIMKKDES